MKIAILTQYYDPDPPSWIATGLARELASRGHDVRVITTFPHYETGKIAEGYRQVSGHLEYDGEIPVRRVRIIPSHSRNPLGRVANYLSFVRSATAAGEHIKDVDVVYAYGTPMTAAQPAAVWAKRWGIPFVVHVQDIWPESVTGSGFLNGPLNRIAEWSVTKWLSRLYAATSTAIAIAPSMKDLLIERGVPEDRCDVVMNWSNDADSIVPDRSGRRSLVDGGLTVLYAGNFGSMQDLETVIRAAHSVRDLEGFRLEIAGFGVEERSLRELVRALGAENVTFLGRLMPDDMIARYSVADFQVVPLRALGVFEGIMPSKIAAGLANGVPLISSVHGDVASMIRTNDLGFTAEPESVDSLAIAFRTAYGLDLESRNALNGRARAYYDAHLAKARGVDTIEHILSRAMERGRT